jgi:hypothetical protein
MMVSSNAMIVGQVTVAGVRVPSSSPVFLGLLGIHILCGLACVISGVLAMLSDKRPGRHPRFGTVYYWCLAVVSVTAAALSARTARRRRWRNWPTLHISGMGMSYVLLLTAFYVDNGKNLPLWRYLPTLAYWLLPSAVGLPVITWALARHPIARQSD